MDYFDYPEAQPETSEGTTDWDLDTEKFLEQSQDLERQRLEEELQRIDQQLERREEIQDSGRTGVNDRMVQRALDKAVQAEFSEADRGVETEDTGVLPRAA